MSNLLNQDSFGRIQMPIMDEVPNIIDEPNDDITYIGYAKRGSLTSEPVWRIKKIETNGNITTIGFVDGSLSYNFVWDNRTSYNYQ